MTTRTENRHYSSVLAHAIKRAKETYSMWVVAEVDSSCDEGREIHAMPLDATEGDEFLAWDGRILDIVERDGFVWER